MYQGTLIHDLFAVVELAERTVQERADSVRFARQLAEQQKSLNPHSRSLTAGKVRGAAWSARG